MEDLVIEQIYAVTLHATTVVDNINTYYASMVVSYEVIEWNSVTEEVATVSQLWI